MGTTMLFSLFIASALCNDHFDIYAGACDSHGNCQIGDVVYFDGDEAAGYLSKGYPSLRTQDHFKMTNDYCISNCTFEMTDGMENYLQAFLPSSDDEQTYWLFNKDRNSSNAIFWNFVYEDTVTGLRLTVIDGAGNQVDLRPYTLQLPGEGTSEPILYFSTGDIPAHSVIVSLYVMFLSSS